MENLKGLHFSCCNLWLRGLDHLKDRREKGNFFRDEMLPEDTQNFMDWEKKNASVLEQLGLKAPQLLNLIKKQKLSYFGHIKRHNTLEKLFLEGTCEGRRGRGRPRKRWTQDIGEWMGVSTVEAGRQALEKGSSVRQFGRPRPLRIRHRRRKMLLWWRV